MKVEASSVLGSLPRLVLAMAQYQPRRSRVESRRTLATAIGSFDWAAPQADVRDVWINHILRREAEALIMPNLPGLVQGTAEPANNEERFALAGSCPIPWQANGTMRRDGTPMPSPTIRGGLRRVRPIASTEPILASRSYGSTSWRTRADILGPGVR